MDHLIELGDAIVFYLKTYENIIMSDFNAEISEHNLASFCTIYNFKSLIKKPACYKNLDNPSCIDLIVTSCPSYFQNSSIFEAGPWNFRLYFFEKRLQHRCFPMKFTKFLGTLCFTEHLRWLLLEVTVKFYLLLSAKARLQQLD